jgi:hypothetical protein
MKKSLLTYVTSMYAPGSPGSAWESPSEALPPNLGGRATRLHTQAEPGHETRRTLAMVQSPPRTNPFSLVPQAEPGNPHPRLCLPISVAEPPVCIPRQSLGTRQGGL